MRPAPFEYHRAEDLAHALALLARFGDDGRPLAAGQSLVPMMNLRLARPSCLVDINTLPLDGIARENGVLTIGALVRHQRYFTEPLIAEHFPAFLEAVHFIGHPTIRRHGSLGGSIAHADPTAELPAICVLHDATIVASREAGERRIPAADFFVGAFTTALEPGEMVTAVEFRVPPANACGSFVEVAERRGDFATASVGVTIEFGDGRITKSAIVCSGADLRPIRAPTIEAFLVGQPVDDPAAAEAGRMLAASIEPLEDHVASASYRRGLIGELARRAITAVATEASTS